LGTASQALNNRTNVLPETRARVLDAATTLGYAVRPRRLAKAGTTERALQPEPIVAVIGMLTKHDLGMPVEINPFFSHVQLGVEAECRARHISLMYANVDVDESNHPITWPRMVSDGAVAGLILVGTFIEDAVGGLNRLLNKPIVLVDSYAPNLPFDNVEIDNVRGALLAVEHLIVHGHRHIGLIGWQPACSPDIHERHVGYLKALAAHGIAQQPSYIEVGRMHRREGYAATRALLRRAPEVTAIFATNDDTAIGVMSAALDLGRRVPQDLSVVGFDNIDLAAEVKPALTTIHVHKSWLGRLGVQQLINRIQTPDQPQLSTVVSTRLIERESVAPPRATTPIAQGGDYAQNMLVSVS
jgi:DNA-binding LacI/PurR family transcriptional regulator